MNPEAIADLILNHARQRIHTLQSDTLSLALDDVEALIRKAIHDAVHEVNIAAPGVAIEDRRKHGGAVVSDLRGVQDKANG